MIRLPLFIGILMCSCPIDAPADHVDAHEVIIIGNATSVPKNLSIKEVRDIYWGRDRMWDNGTPIRVYTLASPNPTTLQFFTQYLGILPTTYWSNIFKQNTNDIFVPTISPSESALYHSVDCNPGAIGFISGSEYNYHNHNADASHNDGDLVDRVDVTR